MEFKYYKSVFVCLSRDGFMTSKIDSARLSKCRRKGRMCEPVIEATLSGSSNMCTCYKLK